MRFAWIVLAGCLGCGGSSKVGIGNDAEPEKIEGGGTGGGALDGRLNVYLFDEDTQEAVEGATVLVGDGTDPDLVAETDAEGLVTFRKAGLVGPLDVTFGKSGYATATVVGLDAANFTAGMNPVGDPPAVGTGTVVGTVPTVADLPAPTATEIHGAFVSFAIPTEEERGGVEQPAGNLNIVINGFGPEEFELTVPEGDVALVAYLIRVILNGPGDEDNEIEYLSIGLLRGITVAEGETVDGVEIPLAGDATDTLAVDWPGSIDGTDEVRGVAGIDLGDDGVIGFFDPQDVAPPEFAVPPLSGDLGGTSFLLYATATDSAAAQEAADNPDVDVLVPSSNRIVRGIQSASDVPAVEDFLALPSGMDGSGRSFSWDALSATTVYAMGLREPGADETAWGVVVLDASVTQIDLPVLPAGLADLPGGDVEMRMTAVTIADFDPQSYVADDLAADVLASSVDGATVSP